MQVILIEFDIEVAPRGTKVAPRGTRFRVDLP